MSVERLTARTKNGHAYLVNVKPDEQEVNSPHKNTLQCILDCFERLAQYEDLEEQGRLVVLPCKVGDTVYENRWGEVEVAYGYMQPQFDTFSKRFSLYDFYKLGKTVFLTREEAEVALQKDAQHE